MNPTEKSSKVLSKGILLLTLLCLALFLTNGLLIPSVAQSTEERELEDKIPKHLPIKVKIKKEKEKAFKDLKNEKWLRDLELEVTNIGDKPIYFLDFHVSITDVQAPNGTNMAFPLRHGNYELGDFDKRAGPDDIPIKPGETYILKAFDSNVRGWDLFRRNHNKPQPKKLILEFQVLSFGDGTGFESTGGIPIPNRQRENPAWVVASKSRTRATLKLLSGNGQHWPVG